MNICKKTKSSLAKTASDKKGTEPVDRYNPIRPGSGSSLKIAGAVIITVIFVLYGAVHYVMNSEPYKMSESFIRQNQIIKAELGEVDKCDPWFPIEMYPFGRDDFARFTFDVIGINKVSTEVSVTLKRKGVRWYIASAIYKDRHGFTKPLVSENRKTAEETKEARKPGQDQKQ